MRLQNLFHKFFGLALLIELVMMIKMMIILIVFVMTKLMEIELMMTDIASDIDTDIGHGDLLS